MNEVITIGVDLAKNVYQVHGVDAEGGVVFRLSLPDSSIFVGWRCPEAPLPPFLPRLGFPRPTPERVLVADHQSGSGFSGTRTTEQTWYGHWHMP